MAINTLKYIENCLSIKTKDGEQAQFHLNAPQFRLYNAIKAQAHANKPIRVIILKARQMGFSTLTEAILFKATATKRNTQSAIVAHVEEATTNLFNMSKFYFETLQPRQLRPRLRASNAKELVFGDLNSGIRCYTASGHGIGRSATIQNLHISELAWWACDKKQTLLGLLQAVPNNPGTTVIIESTANGYDYFKELWDKAVSGESEYYPLFVGWDELPEYSKPYDGTALTPEEQTLQKQFSLTNEQISWRRWCIANQCGGDEELFRQEYPITPYEAFISTGACVFDKESIIRRMSELSKPLARGYFEYDYDGLEISNIRWRNDRTNGVVNIYVKAAQSSEYIIGADTAGDGSDWNQAQVIGAITGEQVATLREITDEDLFSKQLYCLGAYYNDALIAVESNFSSYPNRELSRLGYPNIYVRKILDSFGKITQKKFGFNTNASTRPMIISNLKAVLRGDGIYLINDQQTLKELLTFVRNAQGRAESIDGEHDDCVMSLAIAYMVRESYDREELSQSHDTSEFDAIFKSQAREDNEWNI